MEATQSAPFIVPAQHPPPPPPPQPASAATTTGAASTSNMRKRPLEAITPLQNSPYYKMRAIVRDLRPNFLEVLQTPDFRNGKAAKEIREKMKIFMTLYKEMMGETTNVVNKGTARERKDVKEVQQDMKPPTEQVFPRHAQSKRISPASVGVVQNQQAEAGRLEGTYAVGGSAFGWNFVMFPGNKSSEYYVRTKEEFRAAGAKSSMSE